MRVSDLPNIAVLAGGHSGERDVSVKSAKTIMKSIDTELFTPFLVLVDEDSWRVHLEEGDYSVDLNTFGFTHQGEELRFDYAYIIIHGTPGEDGKIQGYLDIRAVPYSTGSVLNMALTFNKARSQRLMIQEGVQVAKHVIFRKHNRPSDEHIVNEIGLPCFVKPTESGSSIGVSMVKGKESLDKAIEDAFSIHDELIVESRLVGRELACGVLKLGEEIIALPVTEITSDRDFFDYEAKYQDASTREITPAPIPENFYKQCQELSKRIYELTDCKGLSRADFFLCKEGLYFVEINTIPGMSQESLVPKQLKSAGLDLRSIITDIIQMDFRP